MDDLTVIYYTSNREQPQFEANIIKILLEATGDLPIISVSQKPMDLGTNIWMGDIGRSNRNIVIQMREGAINANTKFVGFAESDVLYHKSYFKFRPKEEDIFCHPKNVCLLWAHGRKRRNKFFKKRRRELSCITSRKYFIEIADILLKNNIHHHTAYIKENVNRIFFRNKIPVITIKTKENFHDKSFHYSRYMDTVPHWGTGKEVFKKLEYEYKTKK